MGGTVLDDSKCPKDAENAAVAEELAVQVWRRAVTSCDWLCLASLQGAWDLADDIEWLQLEMLKIVE